jgi:hypothetical protein
MKVFLGTVNIASQLDDWKIGFEKNGCNVTIGSTGNYSPIVEGKNDILISKKYKSSLFKSYTINKIWEKTVSFFRGDERKRVLNNLIKTHDVFFFIWSGILDDCGDFEIIRKAKKKLIVQHVGSDVRWPNALNHELAKYGLLPIELRNFNSYEVTLNEKLLFLRKAEKYANLLYSAPNQASLALKKYGTNPQPINLDGIPKLNKPQRIRPQVLHLPSNVNSKGTKYVFEAIQILKDEGIEFDFICPCVIDGDLSKPNYLPHKEVWGYYQECDILIGQLLLTGGGKTERELLALDKVVLTNMCLEFEQHISKDCPIIDVNPMNLVDELREIITNYKKRVEIASLGRSYVSEYHDPKKITARILRELESGNYECFTYSPRFFRDEFIPESNNFCKIYNSWNNYVREEEWFENSVSSQERNGLKF